MGGNYFGWQMGYLSENWSGNYSWGLDGIYVISKGGRFNIVVGINNGGRFKSFTLVSTLPFHQTKSSYSSYISLLP